MRWADWDQPLFVVRCLFPDCDAEYGTAWAGSLCLWAVDDVVIRSGAVPVEVRI